VIYRMIGQAKPSVVSRPILQILGLPYFVIVASLLLIGSPLQALGENMNSFPASYKSELVKAGSRLFFNPALSESGELSCASCHVPSKYYQDGYEQALSIKRVLHRNTPSILNVNYYRSYFWDGRSDTLEEQVEGPLLSINELHSNEQLIRNVIESDEALKFLLTVCKCKDLSLVSIAIAEYMRDIATKESVYDVYVRGDYELSEEERKGKDLFFGKGGCTECHPPPSFTDNNFHRIGLYKRKIIIETIADPETPNRYVLGYDYGRGNIVGGANNLLAFRTPSLINSALTPPYMHDGSFTTMNQVIDFYDRGGDDSASGLEAKNFTRDEKMSLKKFLDLLVDVRYSKEVQNGN
ncbi:MAG: hypothetical protein LGR52_09700, partial [Candidatus Thiosymbion ectosymbiont of Robbea hypermnestra]|nr:hypothetical protein [Candidatus Thiosymbion ectosymbiont of Robbea hypermnestra]